MNGLIAEALNCGIGRKPKLAPIEINTYGKYTITAESKKLDGFDEVNVDLKDRYDEGYQNGYQEGKGSIVIESLSVTENGTYTHPNGGGYSPVVVNVKGGDYRDYMQGLIDNQANTPNPDRCKDTERSISSGKTYTLSVSDTTYRKPNNWSWLDYHITVNDDDGNIVYDKDCTSYDNNGGTNFLLPYIDTVDGQLRMYYPVVSGSQWTGYIQTWSWIVLW